jgi:hypothetical protein
MMTLSSFLSKKGRVNRSGNKVAILFWRPLWALWSGSTTYSSGAARAAHSITIGFKMETSRLSNLADELVPKSG